MLTDLERYLLAKSRYIFGDFIEGLWNDRGHSVSSFVLMAMKGFYSFDSTRPATGGEEEDKATTLTLIAGPGSGI